MNVTIYESQPTYTVPADSGWSFMHVAVAFFVALAIGLGGSAAVVYYDRQARQEVIGPPPSGGSDDAQVVK